MIKKADFGAARNLFGVSAGGCGVEVWRVWVQLGLYRHPELAGRCR